MGLGVPRGGEARADAFGRASRHSRRVRWLKWVVPAAALLMAAAFFGYSYIARQLPVAIEVASSSIADGKVVMANPKLEGFAKDGRPYAMQAARAIQDLTNQTVITLEGVSARMPIESGNWATVTSAGGIYDRSSNTLQFPDAVTVETTDGMVARFQSAFLDLAGGGIATTDPVDITRDGSTVLADSMSILRDGAVLVFERNVRMTLNPKSLPEQDNGGKSASN